MATLTFGVSHQSATAEAAMTLVNDGVRALFERLNTLGVQPRDIQTTTLGLDPIWSERDRLAPGEAAEIVGFNARNDMSIRLRNLEGIGEVIGLLVTDGANRLYGISFGLRDMDPLQNEARRRAVADAGARAQLYAQAAGVRLGPVQQISEPGGYQSPGPLYARAEAMMASDVPVAAGELSVRAQVTMVFGIAEP
ncbi:MULTISPECIES: SIMPL domain-containing protein [unclassified Marinovum]